MIFTILFILNIFLLIFFNKFSKFINLFDNPDGVRKLHKKPVPSIGGVLIFINLFIYYFFTYYNSFFTGVLIPHFNNSDFLIFFIFFSIFFFIGILDDQFNLNANFKLILFSFVISIVLFLSESLLFTYLNFSFLLNPININFIAFPFLIFCFLLYLNAFNMFDGINLQSSIYSISIFFIFIIKGIFIDISSVMILSLFFFSYLNYKNKCFLGNNGSLLVAFVISYLFIKSQSTDNAISADEIFLAMQVPGLDLLRLAIQRIYSKKHPFHPDRNHIHYLLLNKIGYVKTVFIISSAIIIPNYLSIFHGHTLYYIILTLFIYSFIILRFNKKNFK
jgi:UDP-N-acetylmuramyl pentapeptide phosphotransferase/UDP-N-acetylglucosamine-1-phosphate transferase